MSSQSRTFEPGRRGAEGRAPARGAAARGYAPIRPSAITAEESTPGSPAPGWVPAPTK